MPCPFCGGIKLRVEEDITAYVHCDTCNADGPQARNNGIGKAISKWNKRTLDKKKHALMVCGWRDLSIEVGRRISQPVGASKVRYKVESSGLDIGARVGNTLVFEDDDISAVVRLFGAVVC